MRNAILSILILNILSFIANANGQTIPSTYFGNQMTDAVLETQSWPSVPIPAQRLWDAGVQWADINTSPGVYDFSKLDRWLELATIHRVQLLYTFGRTPAWASAHPSDSSCGYAPGACDPPIDVDQSGNGTDEYFSLFVAALVAHCQGKIQQWELGNEMGNPRSWKGNVAQTVRMSRDASKIIRSVDSGAVILSPSIVIGSEGGRQFLNSYLAAGATGYFDAIAFHGYIQEKGQPLDLERFALDLNLVKTILRANDVQDNLVDTEASWGLDTASSPPFVNRQMQAGFVAIYYLLHWSNGIRQLFWYQYNNQSFGTMWVPGTSQTSGVLLPAGVAFVQVQKWFRGARFVTACSRVEGTIWGCDILLSDGTPAQVVWDPTQECVGDVCSSTAFYPSPVYRRAFRLNGSVESIAGVVNVDYRPVLLR